MLSLLIHKSAAHKITNSRASPLAAVVTHKVRMINGIFSMCRAKRCRRDLNGDTDPDIVPQCLYVEALLEFLDELVTLRKKFPEKRILMSKADVSDAFRNVRVDPDKGHNFC